LRGNVVGGGFQGEGRVAGEVEERYQSERASSGGVVGRYRVEVRGKLRFCRFRVGCVRGEGRGWRYRVD
jgi:hypothetical protein